MLHTRVEFYYPVTGISKANEFSKSLPIIVAEALNLHSDATGQITDKDVEVIRMSQTVLAARDHVTRKDQAGSPTFNTTPLRLIIFAPATPYRRENWQACHRWLLDKLIESPDLPDIWPHVSPLLGLTLIPVEGMISGVADKAAVKKQTT